MHVYTLVSTVLPHPLHMFSTSSPCFTRTVVENRGSIVENLRFSRDSGFFFGELFSTAKNKAGFF